MAPAPKTVAQALTLPVKARLDGYSRNLASGSLFVRFATPDESIHTLEFPACRWLEDRETARCAEVARLQSEALGAEEEDRLGPGVWRRYSLLAEDGESLMEIISRPCKG